MSKKFKAAHSWHSRPPAAMLSESERAVRTSRPGCTAGPEQPAAVKLQGTAVKLQGTVNSHGVIWCQAGFRQQDSRAAPVERENKRRPRQVGPCQGAAFEDSL